MISNASDALDKIRFLSLTDKSALAATEEMSIKIKADKDNNILHVTDTGIGMTKEELVKNLGTIAKSGTSEFLSKLQVRRQYSVSFISLQGWHQRGLEATAPPLPPPPSSENFNPYQG